MFFRLRYRVAHRFYRAHTSPHRAAGKPKRNSSVSGMLFTLALAILLSAVVIGCLTVNMRPKIAVIAQSDTANKLTAVVDRAILEDLAQRGIDYADFVTIQRDDSGAIAALNTNMAAMNLLRANMVTEVLEALEGIDVSELSIPVSLLLPVDLFWGYGPSLRVRSLSVGTVTAEFASEFSSAGINQTIHRIYFNLHIPVTIILPGNMVETQVATQLCVAETVIVGTVPETFLQWGQEETGT